MGKEYSRFRTVKCIQNVVQRYKSKGIKVKVFRLRHVQFVSSLQVVSLWLGYFQMYAGQRWLHVFLMIIDTVTSNLSYKIIVL